MFLFLFLLSNSFVMMIVDRNETKGDLSKKTDYQIIYQIL